MKKLPVLAGSAVVLTAVIIFSVVSSINRVPDNFKLDALPKKLNLSINSRYHLKVNSTFEFNGEKRTENVNRSCKFSSGDESLAQVSDDGYITGRKVGKTSVKITYGNTTRTISVNIKKKNSTYVAHRGAMDFAPHGTIAAVQKAVDLGYQQIECDVRLGKDGNLFIFHDKSMSAMCGINADFSSVVTLKNRRNYPITGGSNVENLPTQYIPTLGEILDIIEKSPSVEIIYLHIKHVFPEKQARRLEREINRRGLRERVTLITADREILRSFDKNLSKGELCNGIYDVEGLCAFVDEIKREDIGINAILYQYKADLLPPDDFVLYAHTNGIRVISYAIDDTTQFEQLRNKGINGIVCNRLLFKLDPSLIKCRISITDEYGTEQSGNEYIIRDTQGKTVASFTKSSEPYLISGKLNPEEDYIISINGDSKQQGFTVANTDDIQRFVFRLRDLSSTQPTEEPNELKKLNFDNISLKAGESTTLPATDSNGQKLSYSTRNSKLIRLSGGKATALKKGTAVVSVTNGRHTLEFSVRVRTSPKLSKKSVTVKKNKTVTVRITGKAKGFDNKYTSNKTAKITSKKSAKSLRIRGLRKGKTTLKITVNGKRLTLKVKVE